MSTSNGSHGVRTSVHVGATVMSADGKQLGVVKQAYEDRFLVNAKLRPDYWLGIETVDDAGESLVQLTLTREAVGSAKLRNEVNGPGLGKDAEDFNGPSPADRPTQTL